ncbi:Glutamyl-tRNA(Gln) amidotransferase subunit B, mitochondrial [Hypsibius exemplaris]|uniref:Glutamyl-tRNA(Gln) amidotransferase subunit B, mitochondrial n=1 Tax=Hypsibius exemplaris TaxID=2072580 RepID=A0A1W0X484_HYPEX|nr:Glutamyl-tRNA(Gln) amidotransferase subunit B, mitochondrial [Hypsibius exemplaris]
MLLCSFRNTLRGQKFWRAIHNYAPLKATSPEKVVSAASDFSEWIGVVGLEIHAQIKSKSKLFSGSATSFAAPTNTQVSLFDCATPGTLPVVNRRCVEAAVKTALALNCEIHPVSLFDRKHYFYADLPAGYQITQHFHPIANNGWMDYVMFVPGIDKEPKRYRAAIEQIQLEQDSGKSLHNPGAGNSLIDLNRAGMGLMEIITRPDFSSGEQSAAFVRELVMALRKLDVCDVRMFEGSLRVDANISVHRRGEPLGVRSEVKNLSSMKFVAKAVDFEIARQRELLKSGGTVINETRGFDFKTETTHAMRDKETWQDYRYMPEPNLPPLRLCNSSLGEQVDDCMVDIAVAQRDLPELPSARRVRFTDILQLTPAQATILVADDSLAELFDKTVVLTKVCTPPGLAILIINSLIRILNDSKKVVGPDEFLLRPADFATLADMLTEQRISRIIFERLLEMLCGVDGDLVVPEKVIEEKQWYQINDEAELGRLCDVAMERDPKSCEAVRKGKTKAVNILVGAVKVLTKSQILHKVLSWSRPAPAVGMSWPSASPTTPKKGGLKGGFRLQQQQSDDVVVSEEESSLQVAADSASKHCLSSPLKQIASAPSNSSSPLKDCIKSSLCLQFGKRSEGGGGGGKSSLLFVDEGGADPLLEEEIASSVQRILQERLEFVDGQCQGNGLLKQIRKSAACTDVSKVLVKTPYRFQIGVKGAQQEQQQPTPLGVGMLAGGDVRRSYDVQLPSTSKSPIRSAENGVKNSTSSASPTTSPVKKIVTENQLPQPKQSFYDERRIRMDWEVPAAAGAGLRNVGNTCFLNATLQCLAYTPPLHNFFRTDNHSKTCRISGYCINCKLEQVLLEMVRTRNAVISPYAIYNNIKAFAKTLSVGRQEDAHEFLRFVIEAMRNTALRATGLEISKLDTYTQETTFASRIFGGFYRSRVICLTCKQASITYEPYLDVPVDIAKVGSLEEALRHYVRPEQLAHPDNYYACEQCKKSCPATKQVTIHKAPACLTFQLKRFHYNHFSTFSKIDKPINFPEELDMKPFMSPGEVETPRVMYRLYAVLVHSGSSAHSGHYYSFVKSAGNTWYRMDDTTVSPSGVANVLAQRAYLLFYTRDASRDTANAIIRGLNPQNALAPNGMPRSANGPLQVRQNGNNNGGIGTLFGLTKPASTNGIGNGRPASSGAVPSSTAALTPSPLAQRNGAATTTNNGLTSSAAKVSMQFLPRTIDTNNRLLAAARSQVNGNSPGGKKPMATTNSPSKPIGSLVPYADEDEEDESSEQRQPLVPSHPEPTSRGSSTSSTDSVKENKESSSSVVPKSPKRTAAAAFNEIRKASLPPASPLKLPAPSLSSVTPQKTVSPQKTPPPARNDSSPKSPTTDTPQKSPLVKSEVTAGVETATTFESVPSDKNVAVGSGEKEKQPVEVIAGLSKKALKKQAKRLRLRDENGGRPTSAKSEPSTVLSGDSSSSVELKRKKKKNKRSKRRHEDSSSETSSPVCTPVWVEKDSDALKQATSLEKPITATVAPAAQTEPKNTVSAPNLPPVKRSHSPPPKAQILSWSGGKSLLDQEAEASSYESRKRQFESSDSYNDQLDEGRSKKFKSSSKQYYGHQHHNHHYHNNGGSHRGGDGRVNGFQRHQNYRTDYDARSKSLAMPRDSSRSGDPYSSSSSQHRRPYRSRSP